MESYTSSTGAQFVDWPRYIAGELPDLHKPHILANNWDTCPVGQLSLDIPRLRAIPKDNTLQKLGIAFFHAVHEGNMTAAKDVYDQIKSRAEKLLTS